MGEIPEWYLVIRAARYLGVAPWDLIGQSSLWLGWALTAQRAESEAAEEKRKLNEASA